MGANVDACLDRELQRVFCGEPCTPLGHIGVATPRSDRIELCDELAEALQAGANARRIDQSAPPRSGAAALGPAPPAAARYPDSRRSPSPQATPASRGRARAAAARGE